MHAIEFQTTITDPYLHIPVPDYNAFKNKHVRVIILDTTMDPSHSNSHFIEHYTHHPVSIPESTDFLTREEAHAR